jgi:DNA-directed RNA polymerase specialized sigma24 family protein
MPTAEIAARLNEIHSRLLAGSRSASRDLFLIALRPIKGFVLKTHAALHDDEAHDLATDAILAYLRDPRQFDAARASLWTYLCMAASSDAVDLLRKQGRQRELLRGASQDVELWGAGANDDGEMENSIDARRIMQVHGQRLATNEPERRILALLLDGERSTEAYAEALGLDPTRSTTTGMVKQAKDRLLLRLRRLRDEL